MNPYSLQHRIHFEDQMLSRNIKLIDIAIATLMHTIGAGILAVATLSEFETRF